MVQEVVFRRVVPVPADRLFAWHERPGAFERLSPPWADVRVVERTGGIRDGDRTVLEMRKGPIRRRWVAVHKEYVPGVQFADEQASGPFASWLHVHRVRSEGHSSSVLEDAISYRLPLGPVGERLLAGAARRELERLFRYRHTQTVNDLTRHQAYSRRTMRIAVTGASGLIGSALVPFLTTGGHEVVQLVRNRPPREGEIAWDPVQGHVDGASLEGIDAVIHLSGEPIPKRWTETRKRAILESRRDSTRLLASTLARLRQPPRVFLASSGIGFYGDRGDELLTEASPGGDGFLAEVCRAWEDATAPASDVGIRVVNLRKGIVITPRGGALARLLTPFRLGLGGRVGSGAQWWSWIGLEDVLGAMLFLLFSDSVSGPVNLTAPEPVTNRAFAKILARLLNRPALLPLPAVGVKILFGQMGEESLLASQRALPAKLEAAGFEFLHPRLEQALAHELGRP